MSLKPRTRKQNARFLLNCLGGTPVIGGVFGALATDWSEQDQEEINQALEQRIEELTEAVETLKVKLNASIIEKTRRFLLLTSAVIGLLAI